MTHEDIEKLIVELVKRYPEEQRVGITLGYILSYYGWTTPEILHLTRQLHDPIT